MRLEDLLDKWGLTSLRLETPFLEADWAPQDPDREAAWDLYVDS